MRIIENTEALNALCSELRQQSFITVDSEFVREKTYYPKLCLLQIGWVDDAAIVDPLAPDMDFAAFFEILADEKILKVFHSGRQDIEIFYNMSGKIPTPVFDTQIAAMVCGFGPSVSYDNLVRAITKVDLDKSSRLTDWSKRPLATKQLEYALRDVTFLVPCYQHLAAYLREHGREHWIDEETAALCDENIYKPDPDNAWLKIRHSAHSPQFLAMLKELAAWRERRAMKCNTPRQSILKDEMLVNIAAVAPKTLEDMEKVRNIHQDVIKGKLGKEILEVLGLARQMPFGGELRKIERERHTNIPSSAGALMEVLRLLLKIKSEQNNVVSYIIASEKNLRDIACGTDDKNNPALNGWRYEIFGQYALAFRKGLATIRYDTVNKEIVIDIVKKSRGQLKKTNEKEESPAANPDEA